MTKRIILAKGKKYIVNDTTKPYHFLHGMLTVNDLNKPSGTIIKTNTGKDVMILDVDFSDLYGKLKKKAQTIPLKDLGYILAYTNIGKDAVVVDAGTGSGASSIFFAHYVKKVYTFDIREDHQKVALKNIENLGIKNIVAKIHNIFEGIPVKNADMILLDVAEPWNAIESSYRALRLGGWLVSYSPTIPQVSDFRERLKEGFLYDKTYKVSVESWEVRGRIIRPENHVIFNHSGFLTFARKIKGEEK